MEATGPKPGLTLTIGDPPPNAQVNIGEKLTVTGLVGGRGGPEPTVPDSVTVQLGDLPPVRATLKLPRFPQPDTGAPNFTYTAVYDSVELPPGPTIITATALFGSNEHVTVQQTVLASVGGTPFESTFTAHLTLQTSSAASGPYHDTIPIGATFSGDRKSVVFNFPQQSVEGVTVTLLGVLLLEHLTLTPAS